MLVFTFHPHGPIRTHFVSPTRHSMNSQLLLLFLSLLPFTTHALQPLAAKRETSVDTILKFHGAVLLKDGKQTSCELALMHNRAAFVPASCFNVSSIKSVVDVSSYQVALDAGGAELDKNVVTVDKVIINPRYNPTTFANNVAVIFFSSQSKKSWPNAINRYPEELTNRAYVRRSMKNEDKQTWNAPAVASDMSSDDGCKKASILFASNPADFWCSSKSIASPVGGSCHVPYGVVYGGINSRISVAAMYSHSAVYGSNMCGDSKAYHYYTILSNYINWATGVVPGGLHIFSSNGAFSASKDPSYTMKSSNASSPTGISLISGDMYARNAEIDLKVTSSSSSSSATTASSNKLSSITLGRPTGSNESSNDDPPFQESSKPKSPIYTSFSPDTAGQAADLNSSADFSKAQIITMAVGIPVAIAIITVALLFVYKRWQQHKKTVAWDPNNEADAIRAIALDLGQPSVISEYPAAYAIAGGATLSTINVNRKT